MRKSALAALTTATVAAGTMAVGSAAMVPTAFADDGANDAIVVQVDSVAEDVAVVDAGAAAVEAEPAVQDASNDVADNSPEAADPSTDSGEAAQLAVANVAEEPALAASAGTVAAAKAPAQASASTPEYKSDSSTPAKFDLRFVKQADGTYKSYVTPVKQQGPWGTCWSFATIAAAESSIMFEADKQGIAIPEELLVDGSLDLSERHLAWFTYIPLGDASANEAGYLVQVGEGFNGTDYLDQSVFDSGGLMVYGTSLFSSGIGIMPESMYPYQNDQKIVASHGRYWSKEGGWSIDELERFGYILQLEESNIFDTPSEVLNNPGDYADASQEFTDRINALKNEIMNGRAVSMAFCADTSEPGQMGEAEYISENYAHYTYKNESANHAVTIIGWDDNYDKSNFGVMSAVDPDTMDPYDEPQVPTSWQPPANGAWLVKNSWGSSQNDFPNYGNWGFDENGDGLGDGYFWISYYDLSMIMCETFNFDVSDLADEKREGYLNNQHDLMPYSNVLTINGDKAVNVFVADHDQEIRALTCITNTPNVEVTYELYKLGKNGSVQDAILKGKNLVASVTVTYAQKGFHTLELAKSLWCQIEEGESFAVAVTQKGPLGMVIDFPIGDTLEDKEQSVEWMHSEAGRDYFRGTIRSDYIDKYSKSLINQKIYGDEYRQKLNEYINSSELANEVEKAIDTQIASRAKSLLARWQVGVVNAGESFVLVGDELVDLSELIPVIRANNPDYALKTFDNFSIKAYGYYDMATDEERATLQAARDEAAALLASVVVSVDGSDVLPNVYWVTQETYDLLADFIRHADYHLGKWDLADYMVEIDLENFAFIKAIFLSEMKPGTMSAEVVPSNASYDQPKSVLAQTRDDASLLLTTAGAVICALPALLMSLAFRRRKN